jgi:hypothetical protein
VCVSAVVLKREGVLTLSRRMLANVHPSSFNGEVNRRIQLEEEEWLYYSDVE